MLWGRARAAIRQLHPLHRSLVQDRYVAAALPPAGWQEFLAALGAHHTVLPQRKWALPERVWTTLVPLLRIVAQDAAPDNPLELTCDLRGVSISGKTSPPVKVRPGVEERYTVDPWLQLRAKLRDGSRVQVVFTSRVRTRTVTKCNPRGKVKRKTKVRNLAVVSVTRTLRPGTPLTRPAAPPPPWIRVGIRNQPKTVLRATAKRLQPPPQEEADLVLAVMSEVFRWTPATPARARRGA